MRLLILLVGLVLTGPEILAAQGGIVGRWEGETPNGQKIVLHLTAAAKTVAGTLTLGTETSRISDGKVEKDSFTFVAMAEGGMERFSGELSDGDRIRFWPDRLGRDRALQLKRVSVAKK